MGVSKEFSSARKSPMILAAFPESVLATALQRVNVLRHAVFGAPKASTVKRL
jgi:hypothetical protein